MSSETTEPAIAPSPQMQMENSQPLCSAFISYGRPDGGEFAAELYARLTAANVCVWFDKEHIPSAVNFQKEIDLGIEAADNFLFVMTPHAVNSPYCRKEIDLAVRLGKRILPLFLVPQIDRATYESRYGTLDNAEWEIVEASGRNRADDRNQNLHSIIKEINWLIFVGGTQSDRFETNFSNLLETLGRDRDYVRYHTELLLKAIAWEQQSKPSHVLLAGDERRAAECWLQQEQFEGKQAPCHPIDLQCELIGESIKNANNSMTQVFLAYAQEDVEYLERVRRWLLRAGITAWTNRTDIRTGTDYETAILQGIERADNLVYLLSPDSLRSQYCQKEFDYAFSLNKRIIPVQVRAVEPTELVPQLQKLQYIELVPGEDGDRRARSELLQALSQDASYYADCKQLLVKALKWEQQKGNPSILLRGSNLRRAEAWLKTACQRECGLTPLQETFIAASASHPPTTAIDLFISYAHADSDFANTLNEALEQQGKLNHFELESLSSDRQSLVEASASPSADESSGEFAIEQGIQQQLELCRAIEQADNFLFILSPQSLVSEECNNQIKYATFLRKRIVAILYRDIEFAKFQAKLNEIQEILNTELTDIHWIDFRVTRGEGFYASFNQLVRKLDTDREHVRQHTTWWQKANDWEQQAKDKHLLLRASELAIAQAWLATATQANKQPPPTSLHREFILASQTAVEAEAEAERQRQAQLLQLQEEKTRAMEARLVAERKQAQDKQRAIAAIGIAILTATISGLEAVRRNWQAKQQAAIHRVLESSMESQQFYADREHLNALLAAIRAQQELIRAADLWDALEPNLRIEGEERVSQALSAAVYGIRESNRLEGHEGRVTQISISADGRYIVSGSTDNTVKLWNIQGELLDSSDLITGHQNSVFNVDFSYDSRQVVSTSLDGKMIIWDVANGELYPRKTIRIGGDANDAEFSPDGQWIVSGEEDGEIKIWRSADGVLMRTIAAQGQAIYDVDFSPDSRLILASGDLGIVNLWQLDGQLIRTLHRDLAPIYDADFSPDGTQIAIGTSNADLWWYRLDGTQIDRFDIDGITIRGISYSPDGKLIAVNDDEILKVYRLDGTLIATLQGHQDLVEGVDFMPDGSTIASGGWDGTIRLWQVESPLVTVLAGHKRGVTDAAFHPRNNHVVTLSSDLSARLWNLEETIPQSQVIYQNLTEGDFRRLRYSPDGQLLAISSLEKGNAIALLNAEGQMQAQLTGHQRPVNGIAFHPQDPILASASDDKTAILWELDGQKRAILEGHSDRVFDVEFSPDGSLIATAGADNRVILWRTEDGSQQFVFEQHAADVFAVAFSPDGELLASSSADRTVKLWHPDGTLVKNLEGHDGSVVAVAFHPEKPILASASSDTRIHLWRWQEDPVPALLLDEHQARVFSLHFSPDGKQLVSSSADRNALVWDLEPLLTDRLLQVGCDVLRDYLQTNQMLTESDRSLCNSTTSE